MELLTVNDKVDIGDWVRAAHVFYQNGVAVDPDSVVGKYLDPSGNETSYTYGVDAALKKPSTGHYYFDFSIDEAGWWYARFVGTGTYAAASEACVEAKSSVFS